MLNRFHSYSDLTDDLRRVIREGHVRTVSFDVFDTLVHRRMAPELVLDGVCHVLEDILAENGVSPPEHGVMALRHEAHSKLVATHVATGLDADTTLDELAPAWLALAAGERLDPLQIGTLGQRLAAAEADLERRVCYANPWMSALLPELREARIQVFCVSDMYLGERYVRAILDNCGLLPWIDQVYVSGDLRLLKRTGRLFGHLHGTLGLQAATWLHVGDNLHADGLMANRHGTRAWIINDRLIHYEARQQAFDATVYRRDRAWGGMVAATYGKPLADEPLSEEEAFGRRVLGPIFASFVHRLLERCREEKIERVFFLAREGHLLKSLYGKLAALVFADEAPPPAVYLATSRLTALLAAMHGYGIRELSAALANTAHHSLHTLLGPLRLPAAELASIARRNGLADIDAPLPAPVLEYPPLQRVLDDPELRRLVDALGRTARKLQHDYLLQNGFFEHQRIAIVDLGWGGQIQDSLFSSIRSLTCQPTLFGFYLGINELGTRRNCAGSRLEGLLADHRTPHWSSFAAFEFVFALEAACRAPHGTTLGYRKSEEGCITPLFKDDEDPSRRAEMAGDEFVALLQKGILTYAERYAECAAILRSSAADTLPYARTMLERLIRYPSRREIDWWMQLNNVSDLGSPATDRLGGWAAAGRLQTLFRLRPLLRNSPFHYGLVGLAAGSPAQAALSVFKGLRTWRAYSPYPRAQAFPPLPTAVKRSPAPTTDQPWESAVHERLAQLQTNARRVPLDDTQQCGMTFTLRELLPLRAAYIVATTLAALLGIALPSQQAPRLSTMLRRHLHARYNLRARLGLLRDLATRLWQRR